MDLPDRFNVTLTDADYQKALRELRRTNSKVCECCLVSQAVRRTLRIPPRRIGTDEFSVYIYSRSSGERITRYVNGRGLPAAVKWFDRHANAYNLSDAPKALPKRLRGKTLTFARAR